MPVSVSCDAVARQRAHHAIRAHSTDPVVAAVCDEERPFRVHRKPTWMSKGGIGANSVGEPSSAASRQHTQLCVRRREHTQPVVPCVCDEKVSIGAEGEATWVEEGDTLVRAGKECLGRGWERARHGGHVRARHVLRRMPR